MNGGWTRIDRRTIEERSRTDRELIENRSRTDREPNENWSRTDRELNEGWTELERRLNGARTELERRMNGGWTELERRTIRKLYRRNCWLNCDTVSLLMIFQELIKVDFGTFLLDDGLYNTLQNLRHIKTLMPNAEYYQTYCLKNISLQPHENQVESDVRKKIEIKFLMPKVMPKI